MRNSLRAWKFLLCGSLICLSLGACGKSKEVDAAAPAAKIYSMSDVDSELKEGQIILGGTRENTRAFFQAHSNYQVCKDLESFTVAVVRNSKVDKHADDIYVVANYNRDGTIGAMEVGPPQFSVGNLASHCQ